MNNEKTLLVLGASSQAGMELIRKVSGNYSRILAHYSKGEDRIHTLINEYGEKIIPVQADLCDKSAIKGLVDHIKENDLFPDHIVHMVSPRCRYVRFHQADADEFNAMISCSVTSFVEIVQPMIKNMVKKKSGKIVVMLTVCTDNIPPKYLSPYITAKYALLGLVRSLAIEYAEKGICVNAVSPEMMDTDFLSDFSRMAVEQAAQNSPMGRLLNVSEVIPTFEYLLSSSADRVTGQNILVTGVR